jgi:radical SAM superfamily enzyme YgiQ (UPF0313 family)
MQTTIIFPFFSSLVGCPPVALSSLGPFLRQHGVDVRLDDLNERLSATLATQWEALEPVVVESLEGRLVEGCKSGRSGDEIRRLLRISVPLIRRVLPTSNRRLGRHLMQALFNHCVFENIFSRDTNLRAPFSELSAAVDKALDSRLVNVLLDNLDLPKGDVLCFSILSETQFPYALLLARFLKHNDSKVPIAFGGPYITEVYQTLLRSQAIFNDVDYLSVHDGESALLAILRDGQSPSGPDHPNVFSRGRVDPSGRVIHFENLNSLPLQDFTGFDLSLYAPADIQLPLFSSRGCTWCRCAFCSTNHMAGYRERRIDDFVDGMIANAMKTGINHFQITDEDIPPARIRGVAEGILKRSATPMRWSVQTRFYRDLDRGLIALMKAAGCYSIEFGLESASRPILKRVRKGISLPIAKRILGDCSNENMGVIVNCMVGFPGEEEENADATVSFLDEIVQEHPDLDLTCNTQVVKVYRHADFAVNREKYSIKDLRTLDLSPVMEWNAPSWVDDFIRKHRQHLLLARTSSKRLVRPFHDFDGSPLTNPQVSLAHDCLVLREPNEPHGLNSNDEWTEPLLVKLSEETYQVFRLNQPLAALVDLLQGGSMAFSSLKKRFLDLHSGYLEADVLDAFGHSLLLLSEKGALVVYEN